MASRKPTRRRTYLSLERLDDRVTPVTFFTSPFASTSTLSTVVPLAQNAIVATPGFASTSVLNSGAFVPGVGNTSFFNNSGAFVPGVGNTSFFNNSGAFVPGVGNTSILNPTGLTTALTPAQVATSTPVNGSSLTPFQLAFGNSFQGNGLASLTNNGLSLNNLGLATSPTTLALTGQSTNPFLGNSSFSNGLSGFGVPTFTTSLVPVQLGVTVPAFSNSFFTQGAVAPAATTPVSPLVTVPVAQAVSPMITSSVTAPSTTLNATSVAAPAFFPTMTSFVTNGNNVLRTPFGNTFTLLPA